MSSEGRKRNRAPGARRWLCTSFKDVTEEPKWVEEKLEFLAYQREVCPETKRGHWQIYVEVKTTVTFQWLKTLWEEPGLHCDQCRGTPEENLAYVTKEDSFDKDNPIRKQFGAISKGQGKHRNHAAAIEIAKTEGVDEVLERYPDLGLRYYNTLKKLEDAHKQKVVWCKPMETLRGFQQMILNFIKEEPNDRMVYWFCDKIGNSGKSKLAIELKALHGAFTSNGGKGPDVIHNATEFMNRPKNKNCSIFVFDFARSKGDFLCYNAIEQLKQGTWSSTKYTGGDISIKPPHMICFANDWPDVDQMSHDRWKLYAIEKEGEDYIASEKTVDWVKTMKGPRDGYGAPA